MKATQQIIKADFGAESFGIPHKEIDIVNARNILVISNDKQKLHEYLSLIQVRALSLACPNDNFFVNLYVDSLYDLNQLRIMSYKDIEKRYDSLFDQKENTEIKPVISILDNIPVTGIKSFIFAPLIHKGFGAMYYNIVGTTKPVEKLDKIRVHYTFVVDLDKSVIEERN